MYACHLQFKSKSRNQSDMEKNIHIINFFCAYTAEDWSVIHVHGAMNLVELITHLSYMRDANTEVLEDNLNVKSQQRNPAVDMREGIKT